ETQEVAAVLRRAMRQRYGEADLDYHCANTSDTLCYATNQNQNATRTVLGSTAALAVIVGGYNSSNTAHLVEICSAVMPSFLIATSDEILSADRIRHFDIRRRRVTVQRGWLPPNLPNRLVVTSGASCPDILMNQVIEKIVGFYGYGPAQIEEGLECLRLLDAPPAGQLLPLLDSETGGP
ncbi:MAG: hypothetical protein AB1505_37165, partial [Candidatus Latescibacterota bacterium]